jgi:hypothetical protein
MRLNRIGTECQVLGTDWFSSARFSSRSRSVETATGCTVRRHDWRSLPDW